MASFSTGTAVGCAGVAAVIMVIMAMGGCLRGQALRACPSRQVGLTSLDLLIGFTWMFGVGPAILHTLLSVSGLLAETDMDLWDLRPWQVGTWMLLAQAATQLPVVLFVVVRISGNRHALRELGLIPRNPARELRAGFVAFLMATLLVLATSGLVMEFAKLSGYTPPETGHKMLEVMKRSTSTWAITLLITSAVLVAPVLEEIIYRGLLQTALLSVGLRSHRWPLIMVASTIFAVIHIGPNGPAAWQTLPGLFLLAMVLGWLYERTGSLLPPILVHVAFNATNTFLVLMPTLAKQGCALRL